MPAFLNLIPDLTSDFAGFGILLVYDLSLRGDVKPSALSFSFSRRWNDETGVGVYLVAVPRLRLDIFPVDPRDEHFDVLACPITFRLSPDPEFLYAVHLRIRRTEERSPPADMSCNGI